MTMENKYIFTSERLGFRNWTSSDLDNMAEINAIAKACIWKNGEIKNLSENSSIATSVFVTEK